MQIPLFDNLTKVEKDEIQGLLKSKSFKKGEILFNEGRACERIFVIVKGKVKVFKMNFAGKEQIINIMEPGDSCACHPGMDGWDCSASSQAITEGSALYLSARDYKKALSKNPKLLKNLSKIFAEKLHCFSELLDDVSLKDVRKRLIRYLLDESERNKKSTEIHLSLTREELAQKLATTRETISRTLSQLKKDKLIDVQFRRVIILDRDALADLLY